MNEPFPSDDIPWATLGRYLADELPADERQAVKRWIDASPERAELIDELRRLWAVAPTFRQQWEVEAAIRHVMRPRSEPARVIRLPAFYRETSASRSRGVWRVAARVAAVITLLGGAIWLARWPTQVASTEVRTLPGQRAELRLPDGSEVKLGPATTMRYAVDSRRGARTIDLDSGEVYFVVTHDADRPFTVRTMYGSAVDLGTRFGVRAYRSDSVIEVAVEEGEVAVAAAGAPTDEVVLAAGDIGTVTASGQVQAERQGDVAARLAWKDGRLELNAVPLREAVLRLSRWYDIEIQLGDSASADRQLRASFQHESATEALQLIAATMALRIERHGRVVTLRSR